MEKICSHVKLQDQISIPKKFNNQMYFYCIKCLPKLQQLLQKQKQQISIKCPHYNKDNKQNISFEFSNIKYTTCVKCKQKIQFFDGNKQYKSNHQIPQTCFHIDIDEQQAITFTYQKMTLIYCKICKQKLLNNIQNKQKSYINIDDMTKKQIKQNKRIFRQRLQLILKNFNYNVKQIINFLNKQCKQQLNQNYQQQTQLKHDKDKYDIIPVCKKHKISLYLCILCQKALPQCPFGCISSLNIQLKPNSLQYQYLDFLHLFPIRTKNDYKLNLYSFQNVGTIYGMQKYIEGEGQILQAQNLPIYSSCLRINRNVYLIGGLVQKENWKISNQVLKIKLKYQGFGNKEHIFKFNCKKLEPLIIPRTVPALAYSKGYLYVIGGYNLENGFLNNCQKINIGSKIGKKKWEIIKQLNFPRSRSSAIVINIRNTDVIFVFGGSKNFQSDMQRNIEAYDTQKNIWEIVSINKPLNKQLFLTGAFYHQFNNKIYVFGGTNHQIVTGQIFYLQIDYKRKSSIQQQTVLKMNDKKLCLNYKQIQDKIEPVAFASAGFIKSNDINGIIIGGTNNFSYQIIQQQKQEKLRNHFNTYSNKHQLQYESIRLFEMQKKRFNTQNISVITQLMFKYPIISLN